LQENYNLQNLFVKRFFAILFFLEEISFPQLDIRCRTICGSGWVKSKLTQWFSFNPSTTANDSDSLQNSQTIFFVIKIGNV